MMTDDTTNKSLSKD